MNTFKRMEEGDADLYQEATDLLFSSGALRRSETSPAYVVQGEGLKAAIDAARNAIADGTIVLPSWRTAGDFEAMVKDAFAQELPAADGPAVD